MRSKYTDERFPQSSEEYAHSPEIGRSRATQSAFHFAQETFELRRLLPKVAIEQPYDRGNVSKQSGLSFRSFYINTIPLHSLKYNSQRIQKTRHTAPLHFAPEAFEHLRRLLEDALELRDNAIEQVHVQVEDVREEAEGLRLAELLLARDGRQAVSGKKAHIYTTLSQVLHAINVNMMELKNCSSIMSRKDSVHMSRNVHMSRSDCI